MVKVGVINAGFIQLMEEEMLVTKPVGVATVFSEFQVNVTSNIGPPRSHMLDAEFVKHTLHYKDPSTIQCKTEHIFDSQHHTFVTFQEVSIDTVTKVLEIVMLKKQQGMIRFCPMFVKKVKNK